MNEEKKDCVEKGRQKEEGLVGPEGGPRKKEVGGETGWEYGEKKLYMMSDCASVGRLVRRSVVPSVR